MTICALFFFNLKTSTIIPLACGSMVPPNGQTLHGNIPWRGCVLKRWYNAFKTIYSTLKCKKIGWCTKVISRLKKYLKLPKTNKSTWKSFPLNSALKTFGWSQTHTIHFIAFSFEKCSKTTEMYQCVHKLKCSQFKYKIQSSSSSVMVLIGNISSFCAKNNSTSEIFVKKWNLSD